MEDFRVELQEIVSIILATSNVNQIYLFGSYANGAPKEDSDLDLCIVTEDEERKIDIIKKIRRALRSISSLPLDILVYYKDEFASRANLTCTLEHRIAYEGVRLYDK